jgi:Flp pilus assembly secretin CpaC
MTKSFVATRSKRRATGCWLALAALLAMAGASQAADGAASNPITINRGETWVIHGVDPNSEPEVRSIDNPNALVLSREPSGDVVVLGADPGSETIRVAMIGGGTSSYTVTVKSIIDPNNRLAPATMPAEGETPPTPQALDAGAGPVQNPRGPQIRVVPEEASAQGPPVASQAVAQRFNENPPAVESVPEQPPVGAASSLPADAIAIQAGTSSVFGFPNRIKRISIADSDLADVEVLNPRQIMLVGRKPGFTTLAVWDSQGHYEQRQVRVEVGGHQQVMLDVIVAELDRTKIENQGIDYSVALTNYGVSLVGLPGAVAIPYGNSTGVNQFLPLGGEIIPLQLSSTLTYGLSAQNSNVLTQTFFEFLEQHQLARVLAQPRLLANSGQEAKFLSGGEIPIIVAQALNTTIVFKPFGTSVVFVPTVIGGHEIELAVKPEVSKPDFTQGVELFGFKVPAFITRRAETVVRMNENQTLIIAGLIQSARKEVVNKIPYLGDLPFAGGLFRNTSYENDKSELLISVTPKIVRPIPSGGELALPDSAPMTRPEIRTAPVSPPDASRPRLW